MLIMPEKNYNDNGLQYMYYRRILIFMFTLAMHEDRGRES
jgi:hypothetical protein